MNILSRLKKLSPFKLVVLYLLIAALAAFSIYGTFTYASIKAVAKETKTINPNSNGVTNDNFELVALFGIQRNENSYMLVPEVEVDYARGFSKALMVYSYDKTTKDVRLLSLKKDLLGNIPSYGLDRIEKAYQIGTGTVQTTVLNEMLDLNMNKFLAFNFDTIEYMVNALKTIPVQVEPDEVQAINNEILKFKDTKPTTAFPLAGYGFQELNGIQTQLYLTLSMQKNDDFSYNIRSNKVLKGIISKLSELKPTSVPFSVSYMKDYMFTNMTNKELATFLYKLNNCNSVSYASVPTNNHIYPNRKTDLGLWYLPHDRDITVKQAHNFIFEGLRPTVEIER